MPRGTPAHIYLRALLVPLVLPVASLTIPTASDTTSSPLRQVYSLTPSLSRVSCALSSLLSHSSSFLLTGKFCPPCCIVCPVVDPRIESKVEAVPVLFGGPGLGVDVVADESRLKLSMSELDVARLRVRCLGLEVIKEGVPRRRGGGGGGGCLLDDAEYEAGGDGALEELLFDLTELELLLLSLLGFLGGRVGLFPRDCADEFCVCARGCAPVLLGWDRLSFLPRGAGPPALAGASVLSDPEDSLLSAAGLLGRGGGFLRGAWS